MRTALKFLIFIFLTASLTSCETIKGWFDSEVEIDTNLVGQLDVVSDDVELKSTEDYSINGTETIYLSENDDLADYTDLINAIRVQNVSLYVLSINSSDVVIRAGSAFTISTPSNSGVSWPIDVDWPIEENMMIDLTAEDYSDLNDMLESDEPVTFTSTGTCNTKNVSITFSYDIHVKVKADPL
jgi:hypothetical protein